MDNFLSGIFSMDVHSILSYSVLGESKKTVVDEGNENIEVEREKICLDSYHYLTRLKITNTSGTIVKLFSAYPIISDNFNIKDHPSQQWEIFNGTRLINDIPGTCVLGIRDSAYANCADRLMEEGYVQKDFLHEDSVLTGDMITVIKAGKQYVSLEILSGVNMLNDISISSDYKGFVKAVRIGGEINCLLEADDVFYTDWVRVSCGGNFLRLLEDYSATRASMSITNKNTDRKPSVYRINKNINYENINDKLTFLKGVSAPFDYVEIGCGWQNYFGDWEAKDDINLINVASQIGNAGYKSGIWTAPLLVDKESELFRNERQWLLRHADGSACKYILNDKEYFILDVSSLACLEYIEMLYQKLSAYGFYRHTVDHLCALTIQKDVVLLDPTLTLTQAYTRMIERIKNSIGENGYLCVNNGYNSPLVGLVDGVQITSDFNSLKKLSDVNIIPKLVNQASMRGFSSKWWHNYASMVIDDEFVNKFSSQEIKTLLACEYMAGGMPCVSDLSNNEELKILKCIIPAVKLNTLPRDAFNCSTFINVVDVEVNNDYHTLCFYNNSFTDIELTFSLDNRSCGGYVDHSYKYNVSTYFSRLMNRDVMYGNVVQLGTIPANSCEIVKIAKSNKPQVILSDMHFSLGGEVDIMVEESVVKITGNNPFNCRGTYVIALPDGCITPDGKSEFSFTVNGAGNFVYKKGIR